MDVENRLAVFRGEGRWGRAKWVKGYVWMVTDKNWIIGR